MAPIICFGKFLFATSQPKPLTLIMMTEVDKFGLLKVVVKKFFNFHCSTTFCCSVSCVFGGDLVNVFPWFLCSVIYWDRGGNCNVFFQASAILNELKKLLRVEIFEG